MKFFLPVFAALLLCGCRSESVTHGIPNLRLVDARANVWRGGQPNAEGWAYLRQQMGITHDLKLNLVSEGGDAGAISQGMRITYCPISFWEQMWGPQPETVQVAVLRIDSNCFIHCSHGQDRTGLVVAEYRVAKGGSRDEARSEMLADGFHRSLLGLDWYWRTVK